MDLTHRPITKYEFASPEIEEWVRGYGDIKQEHLENGEKHLHERFSFPVEIRYIGPEVGYGVFATESIKSGAYLGSYLGKIRLFDILNDGMNNYLFSYPMPGPRERSLTIDAEECGNFTRFINHSFSPNLKPMPAYRDGIFHIILVADLDIKKGQQLSYNYGVNYWYLRRPPLAL